VIGAIPLINMAGHFAIEALVLLAAAAASPAIAGAQGPYCKPFDEIGHHILYTVERAATLPSDSVYRAKIWRIPLLAPSDVVFVTDEKTCERAARAYDREGSPETSTLKRGVYVVRLGTSYLVVDSESRAGEWIRGVVLDSSFAKQSNFIGL